MAHKNLKERRAEIKRLMPLTRDQRIELASRFECHEVLIYRDEIKLQNHGVYAPTQELKDAVWSRDGDSCQYCGSTHGKGIIEHVIPWASGGATKINNLVLACFRCNNRKARNVWVPRNIDVICGDDESLKERIISMSCIPNLPEKTHGAGLEKFWRKRNPIKSEDQLGRTLSAGERKIQFTISLAPQTVEIIESVSEKFYLSRGAAIDKIVSEWSEWCKKNNFEFSPRDKKISRGKALDAIAMEWVAIQESA